MRSVFCTLSEIEPGMLIRKRWHPAEEASIGLVLCEPFPYKGGSSWQLRIFLQDGRTILQNASYVSRSHILV